VTPSWCDWLGCLTQYLINVVTSRGQDHSAGAGTARGWGEVNTGVEGHDWIAVSFRQVFRRITQSRHHLGWPLVASSSLLAFARPSWTPRTRPGSVAAGSEMTPEGQQTSWCADAIAVSGGVGGGVGAWDNLGRGDVAVSGSPWVTPSRRGGRLT
jgi:hypothetical protein